MTEGVRGQRVLKAPGPERCQWPPKGCARYGISTGHRGALGALTIGQHRGRIAPAGRIFPVFGTGSRKHDWRGTALIVRASSPSYTHMHYMHPMRDGTILYGPTLFHQPKSTLTTILKVLELMVSGMVLKATFVLRKPSF